MVLINNQRKKINLSFSSYLRRYIVILLMALAFFQVHVFSRANKKRFIPHQLPAGFVFAHPPEFYGTYETPLENGSIYDYINGGGEVYIKHGFSEVTHIVLKDSSKNTISLDIYDMGTQKNAKEAFADETICPEGFTGKNIGTDAKVYHYEPDFFI
jgi:hypothetical protein